MFGAIFFVTAFEFVSRMNEYICLRVLLSV